MTIDDLPDTFRESLHHLQNGTIVDFLRHDGFPAWVELASASLVQRELAEVANTDESILQRQFRDSQVRSLARRLILARDVRGFSSLQRLWFAFGSPDATVVAVQSAIEEVQQSWPSEVWHLNGNSASGPTFSSACADYIEALERVASVDATGILGAAIRTSQVSDQRSDIGFPLVLRGNNSENLRSGIWVKPTTTLPHSRCHTLGDSWSRLKTSIHRMTHGPLQSDNSPSELPQWLHALVSICEWNVDTLDSAGLSIAMQALAREPARYLPYGVGFTGQWKDDQLAGVTDCAAKVIAAKEAGVFLLFACRGPNEPVPIPTEGVRVVILPEGLRLDDVVRIVNRICADSGLTEHRFRESLRRFRTANATTTAHTPDLPEALDELHCPVGFVGRDQTLRSLELEQNKQHPGRHVIALVAPPRSGKTTLLSRYASMQSRYPIWFSFRRRQATRTTLLQLQSALTDQIGARFCVVPLPSQMSRVPNTGCEQLTAVIEATLGRIDLFVDGIDEAQSPKEVLEWLQQVPGEGSVIVGTQPTQFLNYVNNTQIELWNDTCSAQEDAATLIGRFATRFAQSAHLKQCANQLRRNEWIEGLCEMSGGNLWILTEFLSAVERDRAGWPNSPSDAPISASVREYCQNLMRTVLESYSDDDRTCIETIVAYLSYLDNRSWPIADIRQLAGDVLSKVPVSTWSGTGPLTASVRRLLEFNGTHCRFWSPLIRDAVQDNYASIAFDVARRYIALLKSDLSTSPLLTHVVESVAYLAEVARPGFTCDLLFETDWLHRRTCMLAREHQGIATLCGELRRLKPSLRADSAAQVDRFLSWLDGWGWAIEDSANQIDQWWISAGEVTEPFPRHIVPQPMPADECVLLTPVVGPAATDQAYHVPRPASPEFNTVVCELVDDLRSTLVFATCQGALAVYCEERNEFTFHRLIRTPSCRTIESLCALDRFEVAAVVVRTGDCVRDLLIVSVDTGATRIVTTNVNVFAVDSLPDNGSTPRRLIVVSANHRDAAHDTYLMQVLESHGHVVAAIDLPFVRSSIQGDTDIEIIPFGRDCWAVLGPRGKRLQREGRVYRLGNEGTAAVIEECESSRLVAVNGACCVPGERLAVTQVDYANRQSILRVIDRNGHVQLSIRLSSLPPSWLNAETNTRTLREHVNLRKLDDPMDEFLSSCHPASWHRGFGVILVSGRRAAKAIRLEHEAIPIGFPYHFKHHCAEPWGEPERFFSVSRGRTLMVSRTAAQVCGPIAADVVPVDTGCWNEPDTEIIGASGDGTLFVCDVVYQGYGVYSRFAYRPVNPPFCTCAQVPTPSNAGVICVTTDGWVLWKDSLSVLIGGREPGTPTLHWDARELLDDASTNAKGRPGIRPREVRMASPFGEQKNLSEDRSEEQRIWIVDVVGTGQGSAWVAVRRDAELLFVLVNLANGKASSFHTISDEDGSDAGNEDYCIKLRCACNALLAYDVLGTNERPVRTRICEVGNCGRWEWRTGFDQGIPLTMISLADGISLVLLGKSGVYHCAKAYVHFADSHELSQVQCDDFSCQAFLLEAVSERHELTAVVASILECDGRWSLVINQVQIVDGLVICRLVENLALTGDVTAWSFAGDDLMLVYATGRIEVRRCRGLHKVMALAYAADRQHNITLVRSAEGRFLVTSARGLTWFPL